MENYNKESVTLFFVDIYGTIDGKFSDDDLQVFAKLLKKLKEENESNYLFFDLLSTENLMVVDYYEHALSKYFSDGVKIVERPLDAEVTRETKVAYALYYIERLKKQYDIDAVYYADDSAMLHKIFSDILLYKEGLELHSIIPKKEENNLNFINNEIEERFTNGNSKYLSK